MLDPRQLKLAKLFVFSLVTFSAIIFLIHADSIIYHDSLHSAANKEPPENLQAQSHRPGKGIRSTLAHMPLHSTQEEKDEVDGGNQKGLVAPFNVTEE